VRQEKWLPDEVIAAGMASVSGLLHGVAFELLDDLAPGLSEQDWPMESGGGEQLRRIRARLAELGRLHQNEANSGIRNARPVAYAAGHLIDAELYELIRPERDRQLGGLAAACERACAFLPR